MFRTNAKAAAVTTRNGFHNQKFNNADGTIKGFDVFNFRGNTLYRQCKKCKSDYMKFSVDGFCQDCQQRVEFIVREGFNSKVNRSFQAGGFHK